MENEYAYVEDFLPSQFPSSNTALDKVKVMQQHPNTLANHYGTLGCGTNSGLVEGSHHVMHPHHDIPGCEQCRELAHYFELDKNTHPGHNAHIMLPGQVAKQGIQNIPTSQHFPQNPIDT